MTPIALRALRVQFAMIVAVSMLPLVVLAFKGERPIKSVGPEVSYCLKVDPADLSGYEVVMVIQHAPRQFKLAMATHNEYDDRFWRFIRNFHVSDEFGGGSFKREDSSVWSVSVLGRQAEISYRIQLPGGRRFAHQPFLAPYGGLLGGVQSFLYLPTNVDSPVVVKLELPEQWKVSTGLKRTGHLNEFSAPSVSVLLDCPMMVGTIHQWQFYVDQVPHVVSYLTPGEILFDSGRLVSDIQKIATETVKLFGSMPYKRYAFLVQDSVYGALEHGSSLTFGAPASLLKDHLQSIYQGIAHEFIHAWNLVDIKPAEYAGLHYGAKERSSVLWFSEGFSMFYADLLLRRLSLQVEDSTRIAHLERLITRYFNESGNSVLSPSFVSFASNDLPGALGDYEASVHVQGEMIGVVLDAIIRNRTNGRRSLDDLMKKMYQQFGGRRGVREVDVEEMAVSISGDSSVHRLFFNYIYGGQTIPLNEYLCLLGLDMQVSWHPCQDSDGNLLPDDRMYIYQIPGESGFHLWVASPNSCWAMAGLHTGDALISLDSKPISIRSEFVDWLRSKNIGDSAIVEVRRKTGSISIPLHIKGYDVPKVNISKQRFLYKTTNALFVDWKEGR